MCVGICTIDTEILMIIFLLIAQRKVWPFRNSEARTNEVPCYLTVVHCDLVVVIANAEITGNC